MPDFTMSGSIFYGLLDSLKAEHEKLLSENAKLRSKFERTASRSGDAVAGAIVQVQADTAKPGQNSFVAASTATPIDADFTSNERMRSRMARVECVEDAVENEDFTEAKKNVQRADSNGISNIGVEVVDNGHDSVYEAHPHRRLSDRSGTERKLAVIHVIRPPWASQKDEALDFDDQQVHTLASLGSAIGDETILMDGRRSTSSNVSPGWSCMVHPQSMRRTVWALFGCALLFYDLVMVPVDVCFQLESGVLLELMAFTARVFWTLDIGLTFCCGIQQDGRLIMAPRQVAYVYIKSWLAFDLLLVTIEWGTMWINANSSGSGSSPASILRLFRFSRMVRLLRIVRLVKIRQVMPYIRNVMLLSSHGLDSMTSLTKATLALVMGLHLSACAWHFIGDALDDGWVTYSGFQNDSVARRYFVSLHWILVHTKAYDNGLQIATSVEYIVDSFILVCSLVFCAYYIGTTTNMLMTFATSNLSQVNVVSRRYIRRHKLDYELSYRVEQCLAVSQLGGPVELVREEETLMSALPPRVQSDVLFEVRRDITQKMIFFRDLHTRTDRVLRQLTSKMNQIVSVSGEHMFARGDVATSMFFITQGVFHYMCDELILATTPRSQDRPRDSRSGNGIDWLKEGGEVSEGVLWTKWEHAGDLVADEDALLVCMDAETFTAEVLAHRRATIHAVRYARHFCWKLNRVESCDVTGFDLDLVALSANLYIGGMEDHFAFISHYKVEAGTEATLMKDELEALLRKEPSNSAGDFISPIFVDSDNLVDLTRLVNHVNGSHALILLLTPGLLSRPWCLLEIVAAKRKGRPYVPILVVRPGVSYQFPNEDFYAQLHQDKVIEGGAVGRKLLEENGTTLAEVEHAIRSIFLMIALPFSPHKSAAVRGAELRDILDRCMTVTRASLEELSGA